MNNFYFLLQDKTLQADLLNRAFELTKDREQAKDLRQETLLKALEHEDKFIHGTNIKAWLFTIMHNLFINDRHKSKREPILERQKEDWLPAKPMAASDFNPTESTYEWKEIHRIIHSLPEIYCTTFLLYLQGFKYKEIAQMLKLPSGTVRSRISAARQKIKKVLKDFS